MESAVSERDWNSKADVVKKKCGGYPSFWYKAIIMSGLIGQVFAKFGVNPNIQIIPINKDFFDDKSQDSH